MKKDHWPWLTNPEYLVQLLERFDFIHTFFTTNRNPTELFLFSPGSKRKDTTTYAPQIPYRLHRPPQYFTISSFFSFLGRLAPAIPKQLFGIQHQTYDPKTVLFIRWDEHRYTIDFENRVLGQVSLKELKEICKDLTGVPLGGISLMLKETGALLKDDNAPLSCFGVKAGAVIVVKGHKPTEEEIQSLTTHGDPEEYALILRIQASLQKTDDFMQAHLPKYQQDVEIYLSSNPPAFALAQGMPGPRKRLYEQHGIMSENLLQSLLALDGVSCKPDFDVARVKRREAVKATQRRLDDIDAINGRVKENDKAARL